MTFKFILIEIKYTKILFLGLVIINKSNTFGSKYKSGVGILSKYAYQIFFNLL